MKPLPRRRDRANQLADRTALLERRLDALSRHGRLAAARLSESRLPAEFRTRRAASRGIERDVPDVFTLDDDPAALDLCRLGPSFAINPAWSVLNGELRAARSVLLAESECVLIVDLSRSILSGCLGHELREAVESPEWAKLTALYHAVAAFLGVVEAARFKVRVIQLHGGVLRERQGQSHHGLTAAVLAEMSQHLVASFREAERQPGLTEPFALGHAFRRLLRWKVRTDVVVISDFLDPLEPADGTVEPRGYLEPLTETLARHRVLLVDIGRPGQDREIPLPRPWIDINASQSDAREGARHLEEGLGARWNTRAVIRQWNAAREHDRRTVDTLLARWRSRRVDVLVAAPRPHRVRPLTAQECQARAVEWLRGP